VTTATTSIDFGAIRSAMAGLGLSPKVEPNETIEPDRAFFPVGHRGVLDGRRQLIVGNRGMGKSFWTHALANQEIRQRMADAYKLQALKKTEVAIGFNGSDKLGKVAPTVDEVRDAYKHYKNPDLIWRTVILRAAQSVTKPNDASSFRDVLEAVRTTPGLYAEVLTRTDDVLQTEGRQLIVVFDALDRLAQAWPDIRALSKALLVRAIGLQSFRGIRAKIFMRVDQFADDELFQFPDSSKIRNDRVDLTWPAYELYGLLFFELLRNASAAPHLRELAKNVGSEGALPTSWMSHNASPQAQDALVTSLAGEFMGGHKKRGRVYTWIPLHLGDAANNCSPRTFLTAWKSAADHVPAPPPNRAVDHLGLIEGVRHASRARLSELLEDYPWIQTALAPLQGHFVPISQEELFGLWEEDKVVEEIIKSTGNQVLAPIDLFIESGPVVLLSTMARIAVMEERVSGKINVPDIFRVEAGILRRGGVAVPRKS
jgi:hypothetical protein